jgi:hypothetical protein
MCAVSTSAVRGRQSRSARRRRPRTLRGAPHRGNRPRAEPTLSEHAGGHGPLRRTARLFHEKHVPADALLAPAYAQMPAEESLLLAGWLAEALGAPDTGARDDGPGKGDPLGIQRVRRGLSRTAARGQPAVAGSRVPRWDWGPPGPPEAAGRAEDETTGEQNVALPGPGQPVGFRRPHQAVVQGEGPAVDELRRRSGLLQRCTRPRGRDPGQARGRLYGPATTPGPRTRPTCSAAGLRPGCSPTATSRHVCLVPV